MWACEKDFSKVLPWEGTENPVQVTNWEWIAPCVFTCYLKVISSRGNKRLFGSRLCKVSKALPKQKEKNLVSVARWRSTSRFALPLWCPCCTSICTVSTVLCQRLSIPAERLGKRQEDRRHQPVCSCSWLTGRASEWVRMRQFCLEHHAWRHCQHDKERNLLAPYSDRKI